MATSTNGNADIMRANLLKAVRAYDETTKYPSYMRLAGNEYNTQQLYERAAQVSGLDLPLIRGEFGSVPQTDMNEIYSAQYQGQKRILQFRMSDEAFINDQYGIVKGYGMELKSVFDKAREYGAAIFLNGATDSTQIALPTGQPLSSASQPLASGTDSNTFATQQILGITALEDATAALQLQLAHKGYADPKMGPYQLEVHPKNNHLSARLIGADKFPQTFDNDPNSVAGHAGMDVLGTVRGRVMSPYFANPEWWALRSISNTEHERGMLVRYPFKITDLRYDPDNDSWKVTAKENYLFLCMDYRGTFYSTPS